MNPGGEKGGYLFMLIAAKIQKVAYLAMIAALALSSVFVAGGSSVSAAATGYNYAYVTQSPYPNTVAANSINNVWVEVKNTGTVTWTNSGANPVRLGTGSRRGTSMQQRDYSSEFYDSATWLSANRPVAVMHPQVRAGWHTRFQFNIKAPAADGTYKAYFTPVVEGLGWMYDAGIYWGLTVGTGTPTPTPDPTPVPLPTPGSLTVSLAADTPIVTSLITDADDGSQALAPIAKFNFANGSANPAVITTLKLTRTGVASDTDLANVYLYDGNTRVAEMTSVADRVYSFVNASGVFTVPANSTKQITVRTDLTNSALSGKTIGLSINSANDISAGTAFNGAYPVSGNIMNTATVTDIGRLEVGTTVTAPSSVDPGVTGREVLRFNMVASNQNLKVEYIKLTNVGTIANTDMANIKLMDAGTQLGATAATLGTDGTVVFDLMSAPLNIPSGQTKNLYVVADIVGGTSRNFKLTVQRQSDIVVTDANYSIYVKPFTNATTETFSIIQPGTGATSINAGSLAISVDAASPSGNVALNSTNVELARYKFVASGEAVKILTLPVQVDLTTATNIRNVKLMLDGAQVGSTLATAVAGAANTFPASGDFGSSFIIPAGLTGRTLSIRADISSASGAGDPLAAADSIIARLNSGSSNAQGQISFNSISTASAAGRTLTVQSGTMSVATNTSLGTATATSPSGVKGSNGAKIGSFAITAGAGEGVTISQIQITDAVTNATVATTVHDTIANGAGKSITVADTSAFVIGESYYISRDATPTVDNATITITAKPSGTVLTATVSGLAGAGDMSTGQALTIRSAVSATDTLFDTFQNLRLMQGSTQIGTTVSTLTDTAGTNYTFTPSTSIAVAAGQQIVVDVFADVKTGATTLSVNSDATNGVVNVTAVTATGANTSTSANFAGAAAGQRIYIAGTGALTVTASSDTPIAQQVIQGTTAVELARFRLDPGNIEDLTLTQLVVRDTHTATTGIGAIQNLQLWDGSTLLGTVASLANFDATHSDATFTGLNLMLTKGIVKTLIVKADVTPYTSLTTSSSTTHQLNILSFIGTGSSSGTSLTSSASAAANTMTVVRTKLTVAHASDAPQGASSGANGQTVAKFVVSNSSNVGGYDATLKGLELNIGSTIGLGAAVRYVTIYKNTISGAITDAAPAATGNALGAYGFNGTGTAGNCDTATNLVCTAISQTAFSNPTLGAANFVDVSIAAGSSVTILVTADTADAVAQKNFSAGIATSGITWNDGVSDFTSVDSLPLTGKTLTY